MYHFSGQLFLYVFIGAIGFAVAKMLMDWWRQSWSLAWHELLRSLIILPVAFLVGSFLLVATILLGTVIFGSRG